MKSIDGRKKIPLYLRKTFANRIINLLANLKFSIILLLVIAICSSAGTVIEQHKSLEFYKTAYPDTFSIVNWKLIYFLGLNNLYQTWWYLLSLTLLGISLMTCTLKTQYPMFRIARKWLFIATPAQFNRLKTQVRAPGRSIFFILDGLSKKNYYIFHKKYYVYAYKGLIGKLAPILIHLSLLLILVGTAVSALTGYIAQEIIVKGEFFHIQNLNSFGTFSYIPQKFLGRVNNFWITYKEELVDQFFSDISIIDIDHSEKRRQTIFVNKPLAYNGFTIYQTDWNLSGLRILLDEQLVLQVPLQQFNTEQNQRLWAGSLKDESDTLVSFVIQNLQEFNNIYIYESSGKLIKQTQINDSFFIDKHKIQLLDTISSTGLQIKYDLGIPIIYSGFGLLIVSILINNIAYDQIWFSRTPTYVKIGAKTNKDPLNFEINLLKVLKAYVLKN